MLRGHSDKRQNISTFRCFRAEGPSPLLSYQEWMTVRWKSTCSHLSRLQLRHRPQESMQWGLSVFLQQLSKTASDSSSFSYTSWTGNHCLLPISLLLFAWHFLQRAFLPTSFPIPPLGAKDTIRAFLCSLDHCSLSIMFLSLRFALHFIQTEITVSIFHLLLIHNMQTAVITKTLGYSLLSAPVNKSISLNSVSISHLPGHEHSNRQQLQLLLWCFCLFVCFQRFNINLNYE